MDLSRRRFWILDGGLATEIEKRGIDIQDDPLWSARVIHSNPSVISDIHQSYLHHGADIITTASYQASVEGFCKHLSVSRDKALDLIGQSVTIATIARDSFVQQDCKKDSDTPPPLIAGSVGPYGACEHDGSEYHGNYVDHMTKEDLLSWHRPRVARLLEEGVDLLACETLPAVAEAVVLCSLLQEFPSAKAWVTFACKDGHHTCHGERFSEAVTAVASSPQVIAVGVNCTDPEFIKPLLQSAQGLTDKPFIVYPNAGEDWSRESGWTGNGKDFLDLVPTWMTLGARIIGGCCRVGPTELQKIGETVTAHTAKT